MPALPQLAGLGLLVALAFAVEAATGFGGTVVALTLGALWFPVPALLGWLVPVNLALSAVLVARAPAALDRRFLFARLLPLMAVGLAAGAALGHAVAPARLAPLFAGFVLAVAAWQLRAALGAEAPAALPAAARIPALLGAGLAHGLFASGGPLAVLVSARELPDKAAFRATLSGLWLVLNGLLLGRLWLEGAVTGGSLAVSGLLLAPLGLGLGAGEWAHRRLDARRFRVAVSALLLGAGAVLLAGSLSAGVPR